MTYRNAPFAIIAAFLLCVSAASAAQDDAERMNALLGAADKATASGNHETAAEYLGQLLNMELRPVERFEVLLMRGNAHKAAGNTELAARDWRAALDTGEATLAQQHAILNATAALWVKADERERVEEIIDNWPLEQPPSEAPVYYLAKTWTIDHEFGNALDYTRPLVDYSSSPNHMEYLRLMLFLLTAEGRDGEIENLISRFEEQCTEILSVSDADASPAVRIAVQYPYQAAKWGREGHCDMTFDVNRRGETENIRADCSKEIFERTSIKTVEKWLYLPKIVDGNTEPRYGIQTRLTYDMQD